MRGLYLAADDPPFLSTEYLLDFFRGLLDISLESIGTRVHTTSETSWHWDFSDDEVVCSLTRPSVGTDVTILEDGTIYELATPINGVDKHSRIVASTFVRPASIRNIVELGDLKDDIELVASLEGTQSLFEIPLWRAPAPHIQTDIVKLLGFLEATDNDWSFWTEWLKGLLDGRPLDWELQHQVALIDDAIWDAGPEAVAAEIERIRRHFELEQEVARLKEQLAAVERTPAAALIGDNGGPPLEDAAVRALQTDLALIWKQVEELEEEIAKPSPSPSLLEKIAKTLWEISLRMAAYCGSVADGMIREGTKELAKAGAKWTAGATVVTFTAQTESVQSVVKAIGAFVKALQ